MLINKLYSRIEHYNIEQIKMFATAINIPHSTYIHKMSLESNCLNWNGYDDDSTKLEYDYHINFICTNNYYRLCVYNNTDYHVYFNSSEFTISKLSNKELICILRQIDCLNILN